MIIMSAAVDYLRLILKTQSLRVDGNSLNEGLRIDCGKECILLQAIKYMSWLAVLVLIHMTSLNFSAQLRSSNAHD